MQKSNRNHRTHRNSIGGPGIMLGSPGLRARTPVRLPRARTPRSPAASSAPQSPDHELQPPCGPMGGPVGDPGRRKVQDHDFAGKRSLGFPEELGSSLATKVGFRARAVEHLHQEVLEKPWEVLFRFYWDSIMKHWEVLGGL